jgi:hypothetical protein
MLAGSDAERRQRYERFLERAVALRRDLVPGWRELWQDRPLAEARCTGERLDEIETGAITALTQARVAAFTPDEKPVLGMCGRLDTYLPEGWAR